LPARTRKPAAAAKRTTASSRPCIQTSIHQSVLINPPSKTKSEPVMFPARSLKPDP
jgi:hypothetical protein